MDSTCLLPFEQIKREVIIKRVSKASLKYGCEPHNRKTEDLLNYGIVIIDKPRGPTSHQVSSYVQEILHIEKAGHTGTLDPNVTGVLPVALGKSTKITQVLLTAGKEYVALMHLHHEVPEYEVYRIIEEFIGKIRQLPPMKSSVKRQWRERKIYYIKILGIKGKDVLFKVGCEAGTYIRKLIHDIGQKMRIGANMQELVRTKAGPFNESGTCTLQDLADAYYYWKEEGNDKYLRRLIQPIEDAVAHLPKIWVLDSAVHSICHGANLNVPGISKLESDIEPDQIVAILTLKNELIAYGRAKLATKAMLEDKGYAVNIDRVFMEPDTYPKMEREIEEKKEDEQ